MIITIIDSLMNGMAHRWLPLWSNVISLPGEIAAQPSGGDTVRHPFAHCIYISIGVIGIIGIISIIVIIVNILRSIPDVSEWKDAARLCMLRLWVSLEFIRASRVTFFLGSISDKIC